MSTRLTVLCNIPLKVTIQFSPFLTYHQIAYKIVQVKHTFILNCCNNSCCIPCRDLTKGCRVANYSYAHQNNNNKHPPYVSVEMKEKLLTTLCSDAQFMLPKEMISFSLTKSLLSSEWYLHFIILLVTGGLKTYQSKMNWNSKRLYSTTSRAQQRAYKVSLD